MRGNPRQLLAVDLQTGELLRSFASVAEATRELFPKISFNTARNRIQKALDKT